MIYQKLTTGMGQCLLLIRKHADRDGFEFFDMRGELTDISEAEALELIKELRE